MTKAIADAESLKAIFDAAPQAMLLVGPGANVVAMNRAAQAFAGRAPDNALNVPCGEVMACLQVADGTACGEGAQCPACVVRSNVERTVETGLPVCNARGQLAALREGVPSTREVLVSTTPVMSLDGPRILLSLTDITDETARQKLHQMEQETRLRESEDRYRVLVESLPSGVFVVEEGKIAFANRAGAEILGYLPEELVGQPAMSFISAASFEQIVERFRKLDLGQSNPMIAIQAIGKGGAILHLETSSTAISYGGRRSILIVCRDVTQQKEAREALRQSQELLNLIFQNSEDGINIAEFDPKTCRRKLALCNDRYVEMSGFTREQLMAAEDLNRLVSAYETPEKAQEDYRKMIEGVPFAGQNSWLRPDGKENHYEWAASSIRVNGRLLIVGVDRDITERKRTEEALRQSQELLNLIFQNSEDGINIAAFDPKTCRCKLVLCNDRYVEMSGYTREQLMAAEDINRLVEAQGNYEKAEEAYRKIIEGVPFAGQNSWLRPDGKENYHEWAASSIRVNDRLLIVGVDRDITERKKAQEHIRSSEQQYRSLFEHMTEGVAYCQMIFEGGRPVDFIYLAVNQAFYSQTGLTDVVGKRVSQVIPGLRESDPELLEVYGRVASTGKPRRFEMYVAAIKDWYAVSVYSPLKDHFVAVFYVVTERKEAEEAIRESEEDLESAQRLAQIGSWRWNMLDNTARWSKETFRIFEREGDDLKDHRISFLDMIHPEDRQRVDQTLSDAVSGQKPYDVEFRITTPSGRKKIVHSQGEVLRDERGEPVLMRGSIQDITERRHMETQYRQAQKMEAIGRLAAGVAHDFNNQLTVIQGYAEMLLQGRCQEDPQWGPLQEIAQAAERAASTTSHLLSFSRKQILQAELVNPGKLLKELEKPISRLIGEDIRLTVAAAPNLPQVLVDKAGLHQAIMNLAINARDAMPSGGELKLQASSFVLDAAGAGEFLEAKPGQYVLLEVIDSGSGMDSQTLERAFEPFFTTKEPGKGTGLGLTMVIGFMRQSHGAISIRSQLGKGTTVRLLLPPGQVDTGAAQASSGIHSQAIESAATLLVVEDEPSVRQFVVGVLRQAGHRVLEAESPAKALELSQAHSEPIDLLITDMIMPGMRGDVLARQLVAQRRGLRTLFITGHADKGPEDPDKLLAKPFTPKVLLERVQGLLRDSRRGSRRRK